MKGYMKKHGTPFTSKGVPSVEIRDVTNHEGAWKKVLSYFLQVRRLPGML